MAHPDFDELINHLFNFSRQLLAKHGEFYPFGISMDYDGKISLVHGQTESSKPESREVIEILTNGFHKNAVENKIKATGICFNVRAVNPANNKKEDAICAKMEHQCGEAVDIYLPYRKGLFGLRKYGVVFACKGKKEIF